MILEKGPQTKLRQIEINCYILEQYDNLYNSTCTLLNELARRPNFQIQELPLPVRKFIENIERRHFNNDKSNMYWYINQMTTGHCDSTK